MSGNWTQGDSRRTKRARDRATTAQHGLCFWCDVEMGSTAKLGEGHHRVASGDHLIPRTNGGKHDDANVVAACLGCNYARKDNPIDAWLSRLKFRLTKAGNPQHFDVVLQRLTARGISHPFGQPSNGPDMTLIVRPG